MYKARRMAAAIISSYRELNRVTFERLSVERRLRSALVRKQLCFISAANQLHTDASSVERVRWRAPQGACIVGTLISVAEHTGLIVPIANGYAHACDQARSWRSRPAFDPGIGERVAAPVREGDIVRRGDALEQAVCRRYLQLN